MLYVKEAVWHITSLYMYIFMDVCGVPDLDSLCVYVDISSFLHVCVSVCLCVCVCMSVLVCCIITI